MLLRVSDTGEGMPDEVQRHVFEPFFTTKAPGKGTGLGLATVYGVVTQAGGQITFHSKPGIGTTFEIFLPRSAEAEASQAPEPPKTPRRATETILVVEDDAAARDVTVRALRGAGYRILVAVDARQALEVYGEADAPVDLLLTDLVMPGGTGKDVADALRARQPSLRVLYVSGYTQDTIVHRGVLDAGLAFLAKPFTPSSLLAKVGEVLDGPAAVRGGGAPKDEPRGAK